MPKINSDWPATRAHCGLLRQRLAVVAGGLLVLTLSPSLPGADRPATPTIAQVLTVCERGYAAGDKGVDAAICEWYTNPCGCKPGATGPGGEIWCIPAAEPTAATIRKVVTELRRQPDPAAPVERVVPAILARLYPCRPTAGESSLHSPK